MLRDSIDSFWFGSLDRWLVCLFVGFWLFLDILYDCQGRAIRIGYCIVFTILASIGFTQYLLWVLLFSQYNTIQKFFFEKKVTN